MSIPVMRAVVDSERYGGLRKLVLLALAAYSDPDGTSIFPSVDTVAKKTGLSARPVQRHMRALEREGVLVRVARSRRHRPNEYRIDLQALGVSLLTLRGVAGGTLPTRTNHLTCVTRRSPRLPKGRLAARHRRGKISKLRLRAGKQGWTTLT